MPFSIIIRIRREASLLWYVFNKVATLKWQQQFPRFLRQRTTIPSAPSCVTCKNHMFTIHQKGVRAGVSTRDEDLDLDGDLSVTNPGTLGWHGNSNSIHASPDMGTSRWADGTSLLSETRRGSIGRRTIAGVCVPPWSYNWGNSTSLLACELLDT